MSEKWLRLFLKVVGVVTLFAFAAAVMPAQWMEEIAGALGIEPFPRAPLTFYLARNLSLLYGFAGCLLLIVAADLSRYRPLVRMIAYGAILFGILQAIVDAQSGMPWWWTAYESVSSIIGGLIIWWLDHRCQSTDGEPWSGMRDVTGD
jgi:hypothetical protein